MKAAARVVKLFGERNTGTRALQALLRGIAQCLPGTADEVDETAYRALRGACGSPRDCERAIDAIFANASDRCAWKHCATRFQDAAAFDGCLVLFAVRHPASWLTGLFRRPYHALAPVPGSIAEFLDFEWETVQRERLVEAVFRPLELYHAKLRSYAAFSKELAEAGIAFEFIRFEDIVLRQEEIFRTIAACLGSQDAPYTALQRSTKDAARTLDDYRDYYGRERWRELLAGIEHEIDRRIDWDLVAPFGYGRLDAAA